MHLDLGSIQVRNPTLFLTCVTISNYYLKFIFIEVWMEEPGRLQSMGSRRVGHN